MRDDIELEVRGRAPVFEYGRSGGILMEDDGVCNAIAKFIAECGGEKQ